MRFLGTGIVDGIDLWISGADDRALAAIEVHKMVENRAFVPRFIS